MLFGNYEGLSKHARYIKAGLHLHLLILLAIDLKEIGEEEASDELEREISETYIARRDEFGHFTGVSPACCEPAPLGVFDGTTRPNRRAYRRGSQPNLRSALSL